MEDVQDEDEESNDHAIDVEPIDMFGDVHAQNEERVGDEGTRRSGRASTSPKRYEPSFTGKKYEAQFFNIRQNTRKADLKSLKHSPIQVLFAQLATDNLDPGATNFDQMSFKKGKELFGERAVAGMIKEYQQMEDMAVLAMVDPSSLTDDQKKKALRAVNLIKQKRTGNVKGRLCANGAPHRRFVPREEARSPTMGLESLITSMMIDAYEGRKVSIFDCISPNRHT